MTSTDAYPAREENDGADRAHPAVLVVDGANVVGARADGWWRDREGAAERLHTRLAAADLGYSRVVLVLEGKARPGVEVGVIDAAGGLLETVHAPGSGDDEIVAQSAAAIEMACAVDVVTADRGLRARIEALGGRCLGPSWLLAQLG